ncbi:hypothetical protein EWM62_15285 [Mucilaginibacter terrigena]|uniref:Adhesin domain-containing protein n=1 Tax=Mucilaginibacter terrigena TaxID=2492395 RepID=A0A4Q5LI88_9SPHI|nr:hypothetical protein [Mucilaginibacter terrigena]RYU87857.1 hypothetical protein EWM62_15285 [Mucilaginibacter terrigena]
MKTKIFKHGLLAAIAVLAISTTVAAQDSVLAPPAPPAAPKVYVYKNKALKQNMAGLKVKMKQLQKQMNKKNFKMNLDMDMNFAFKDLDKNFTENFKDFGKNFNESFKDFGKNFGEGFKDFGENFSGSFSDLAPNVSGSFSNMDGINFSNNFNDDEYKQKLASGQVTEKVKNYSKSYSADANDILQINNSFGKVVVNTWAKNEFKVDVQMKFGSEDEDFVNKMMEGSSISDSKSGSVVSFKTNLANIKGRHGNTHMEINYTIYMPAGNMLDLTNKFGSVTLPDLSGKTLLRVSYGTLNAQRLLNRDNDVKVNFGDANIVTFNGGKLYIGYGKLKAGTVSNVDANISFAGMTVDRLKNNVDVNIKYGNGFDIGAIDKSVRNLTINASFTKIKLDFKDADSFNFDVVTKFGGFNYDDDNMKVTTKTPGDEERGWSSTKTYKGYIGKNNSDGKIAINASYTDVKFY